MAFWHFIKLDDSQIQFRQTSPNLQEIAHRLFDISHQIYKYNLTNILSLFIVIYHIIYNLLYYFNNTSFNSLIYCCTYIIFVVRSIQKLQFKNADIGERRNHNSTPLLRTYIFRLANTGCILFHYKYSYSLLAKGITWYDTILHSV